MPSLLKIIVFIVGLASIIFAFQNCGETSFGSHEAAQFKFDNSEGPLSLTDEFFPPAQELTKTLPIYHWKCLFELRGEKNYRWKVERHSTVDDDCMSATQTVKINNPKAHILSTKEVFMGYHDPESSSPYHWKCEFTLRGQKGNQWDVERYLKFDDDCAAAEATVLQNNPNAKIRSKNEVFVGYHDDGSTTPYHWKCAFTLQGERGHKWDVERWMNFDDECHTAELTVQQNNPKAKITSKEKIFMGYQ